MSFVILLPPSEGKTHHGDFSRENLSFSFQKPVEIIQNATQKDLKCQGKRFEEAQHLNQNIEKGPFLPAIQRYNGVMYKSINFEGFLLGEQEFFQEHFLILSGMYGMIKPGDIIGNYKLPIETKGLALYWKEIIAQTIENFNQEQIIDLLPLSYKKMIDFKKISKEVITIDFINTKTHKKISHGVKNIKGDLIQFIVKNNIKNIDDMRRFAFEEGILEIKSNKNI